MRSWSRFEVGALVLSLALGLAAGIFLGLDAFAQTPGAQTKAIGSVVYKLRTAEARHNDQALWADLPQNSAVYELDTVRTASESSADVFLAQTTKLTLGADTMVRLELGGQSLRVQQGVVRLKSKASHPVTVKTAGASVTVSQGEAVLSTDGTSTTTTVVEGTATMVTAGTETQLSTGSTTVDATGKVEAVPVTPLAPLAGAVVWTSSAPAPVVFSWAAPEGWEGRLVVSQDKALGKPVVDQNVSGAEYSASLSGGTWWWTLSDSTNPGKVQRFEVKTLQAPVVLRPTPGAVAASVSRPELDVRWTPVPGASGYRVEIATDSAFTQTESSSEVTGTSLSLKTSGTGDRWLRVVAVFASLGLQMTSEVRPFTIGAPVPVPLKWADTQGETVQINRAQVGLAGTMKWQADPDARFRVRVAEDEAMQKIVSDTVIQGDSYRLEGLAVGTYFVEVSHPQAPGEPVATAQLLKRMVTLTKPLAPVLVEPVAGTLASVKDSRLSISFRDPNASPRSRVVVASDPAFSNVLAQAPGRAGKAQVVLPSDSPSTLYWRVDLVDEEGSVLVSSSPESFRIPVALGVPQLLSPAPGTRIDLFKNSSVSMEWSPVEGANLYRLTLYRTVAGQPTKVRSWEASETSVEWKDFAQLKVDTYTLDLVAFQKDSSGQVVGQSPVVKSAFRLDQSAKVKAIKLEMNLNIESD